MSIGGLILRIKDAYKVAIDRYEALENKDVVCYGLRDAYILYGQASELSRVASALLGSDIREYDPEIRELETKAWKILIV